MVRELVLPAPIQGRPSVDVNPFVGMWVIRNQEVSSRQLPPRYRIAEYVPFVLGPPGSGGPVAAEDAAPIAPLGAEAWPNYGQSYPDERVIQDGRWYVRANKIIALLVQLARAVAQCSGWRGSGASCGSNVTPQCPALVVRPGIVVVVFI
ncbi:MAG: hypothetical protein IPP13_28055 [Kouleothrix sp.]|nr:hypothetical protein [Kouleothrix sp.]